MPPMLPAREPPPQRAAGFRDYRDGGRDSSANVKSFFPADFTSAVKPLVLASV